MAHTINAQSKLSLLDMANIVAVLNHYEIPFKTGNVSDALREYIQLTLRGFGEVSDFSLVPSEEQAVQLLSSQGFSIGKKSKTTVKPDINLGNAVAEVAKRDKSFAEILESVDEDTIKKTLAQIEGIETAE